MNEFYQAGPALGNQYDDDRLLRAYLQRVLPTDVLAELEPGLHRLGARAVGEIQALGDAAEAAPPRHVPYDPWGRRIDRIEVSEAWKRLERISAEEGLIATAYERKHGQFSRVHQFARLYLFHPTSAVFTCPLAMTDGAARALELYGDEAQKARAFTRLTSRDPDRFWTSGQWMTERTGGSDVSGTSTVARLEEGQYRLYGTKWFTSATTSQMAMALARIEGAPEGSRGLSLFYLELRDDAGHLKNIMVHRLKDKLGTRAVPTAELTLQGTPAQLVGGEGHGVRKISSLFNLTRIYNATCAVASMRRGLALTRDYASRRVAFGRRLSDHPLHLETLAALEVELQAGFLLTFKLVELLGQEEVGEATDTGPAVLRLLTPIAKLYTGKQTVASMSEVLESFGGAGYVEDTGLPRLLRDAQVLPIWEGTTNVLSMDMLRAIDREHALEPFLEDVERRLAAVRTSALKSSAHQVRDAMCRVREHLQEGGLERAARIEAGARSLAFSLGRIYMGSLMLEHADHMAMEGADGRSVAAARRWCAADLTPLTWADAAHRADSRLLALDLE